MKIRLDPGAFHRATLPKLLGRFVWGGTVTVLTGLLAERAGPVVGGFFLAFPAIFPVSVILLARRENRSARGHLGFDRGRHAAVAAASGTSLGAVGLVAYAVTAWLTLRLWSWPLSLATSAAVWALVAWIVFLLRKKPGTRVEAAIDEARDAHRPAEPDRMQSLEARPHPGH